MVFDLWYAKLSSCKFFEDTFSFIMVTNKYLFRDRFWRIFKAFDILCSKLSSRKFSRTLLTYSSSRVYHSRRIKFRSSFTRAIRSELNYKRLDDRCSSTIVRYRINERGFYLHSLKEFSTNRGSTVCTIIVILSDRYSLPAFALHGRKNLSTAYKWVAALLSHLFFPLLTLAIPSW